MAVVAAELIAIRAAAGESTPQEVLANRTQEAITILVSLLSHIGR